MNTNTKEPITVIHCRRKDIGFEVVRSLYKCRECCTKFHSREKYQEHHDKCLVCNGCHVFQPLGSIFSCETCGALSPKNQIVTE